MVGFRGVRRSAVFSSYFHGSGAVMSIPCVPGIQFAFRMVWLDAVLGLVCRSRAAMVSKDHTWAFVRGHHSSYFGRIFRVR